MQQSEIMQSSNRNPIVQMLLILALAAGPYSLVKTSYASETQGHSSSGSEVRYSPPQKQNRYTQNEENSDTSISSDSSDQNSNFPSPPSDRTNRVDSRPVFTNRIEELKANLERHLESTNNLLLTLQNIDMEELENNQRFIRCASKFLPSLGYSRQLNSDDDQSTNQITTASTAIPVSVLQQNGTSCLPGEDCRQNTQRENITSSTQSTNQLNHSQQNQTLTTSSTSTTTTTTSAPFFPPRPNFPSNPNSPSSPNFPPRPNFPSSPNFPRRPYFPPRPNLPAPGRSSSLTNIDKDNLEKIGDTPVRAEESLKVFQEHMTVEEYERLMEDRPRLPPSSGPQRSPFTGQRKKSFSTSCTSYKSCLHVLTSLKERKK